jgi:PAS domain S-box-containing protein
VSTNCLREGAELTVFGFAHDITKRKRNEEAIQQNEMRYHELADSISHSFAALDRKLRYVYWNKACEEITGIKAEKAVGHHLFEVFPENDGTRKVAEAYRQVLKTGKRRVFVDELNFGGRRVFVENNIYPTRTGISVFTKDITRRTELQAKLESYNQQLAQLIKERTEQLKVAERLATIGETAGMVGHDIRSPLQTIAGELFLAKSDVTTLQDGEIKRNLLFSIDSISQQLNYINKIVGDLQDYAKTPIPNIEDTVFEELVNNVLASVTALDDIRISTNIKAGFPKLRSDPLYLKRILVNLTTNAVQAMPAGGSLTVTADYDDKNVFVSITDTGGGIPEDVKTKLFSPLFTTKAKGQGLGLAVVKKLTTALGGNVTFKSTLGQGTTFLVTLPRNM